MTEQKYLDPHDAVRLMLDGEELIDSDGDPTCWDGESFICTDKLGEACIFDRFDTLRRKPPKEKRLMTKFECLVWAQSDEAKGWLVALNDGDWVPTQYYTYNNPKSLKRARFDASGIDESTITDFSVEVN